MSDNKTSKNTESKHKEEYDELRSSLDLMLEAIDKSMLHILESFGVSIDEDEEGDEEEEYASTVLEYVFEIQAENQREMLKKGMYHGLCSDDVEKTSFDVELPIDDPKLFSYHVQQLMSEIGELLDADKRWKNFRNGKYDKDSKLEEIADCFIVLVNICLFSGVSCFELINKVIDKIKEVRRRIDEANK
jgi:NTP pyrophosphatase (non-canonical NTP hydrolase)